MLCTCTSYLCIHMSLVCRICVVHHAWPTPVPYTNPGHGMLGTRMSVYGPVPTAPGPRHSAAASAILAFLLQLPGERRLRTARSIFAGYRSYCGFPKIGGRAHYLPNFSANSRAIGLHGVEAYTLQVRASKHLASRSQEVMEPWGCMTVLFQELHCSAPCSTAPAEYKFTPALCRHASKRCKHPNASLMLAMSGHGHIGHKIHNKNSKNKKDKQHKVPDCPSCGPAILNAVVHVNTHV